MEQAPNSTLQKKSRFLNVVIVILAIIGGMVVLGAVGAPLVLKLLGQDQLMAQARDSQRISDLDTLKMALAIYNSQNVKPLTCVMGKIYKSTEGTTATDGTGWVPINLNGVPGGPTIPYLPEDPNGNKGGFYSFACDPETGAFEIDAVLESDKHKTDMATDEGNSDNLYEVGSNLDIIK